HAAYSAAPLMSPTSSSFHLATLPDTSAALTRSSRALSTRPTAFAFDPCSTALGRLCHYNSLLVLQFLARRALSAHRCAFRRNVAPPGHSWIFVRHFGPQPYCHRSEYFLLRDRVGIARAACVVDVSSDVQ